MFISLTVCSSPFLQYVLYYGVSLWTYAKHPQNGNEASRQDTILREICTFGYFYSVRKPLFICPYRHLSGTDGIFLHLSGCQIPQYPLKAMHYFLPFPSPLYALG